MTRRFAIALACASSTVLLVAASPALAVTTYSPTRLDDPVSGGTTCSPPAPVGGCSLRGALAAAGNGDTVQLGAGTYTLTQGALTTAGAVTILGAGPGASTVKQMSADRVFLDTGNGAVVFRGLTMTGGNLHGGSPAPPVVAGQDGSDGDDVYGAGIEVYGSLALTDVAVVGNTATGGDGAHGAAGSPGGAGGSGGGAGEAIDAGGSITLTRVTVADNHFVGGRGGDGGDGTGSGKGGAGGRSGATQAAISTGLAVTITDSLLAGNTALPGRAGDGGRGGTTGGNGGAGGLGNQPANGAAVSSTGPVALTNVTFAGNTGGGSDGGDGGAARAAGAHGGDGGHATGARSGAVAVLNGAALAMASVTLAANTALPGVAGTGGAAVTHGNAGVAGPAYAPESTDVNVYDSTARAIDTIFAGVTALPTVANCAVQLIQPSDFTDLGHNLDDGDTCLGAGTNGDLVDHPTLLGALGDHGGPTQTIAPLAGSPAIRAGAAACVDAFGGALPTDQRGLARTSPCDIGAFQGQPARVAALALTGAGLVGTALACNAAVGGDAPVSAGAVWLRDGAVIPAAAGASYATTPADLGHRIACRETVNNAFGAATVDSNAIYVYALSTLPPTVKAKLSKLEVGATASVRRGHKVHVTFSLTLAAKVSFSLVRRKAGVKVNKHCVALSSKHRHPNCTRLVLVTGGPKAVSAKTGATSVSWTPSRKLAVGSYVLTATPRGGKAVTRTFAVKA